MNDVVATLAPSFLIGSSSFLQTTRTHIKSRMGSKFGQIGPWTVELATLERLENPHRLIRNIVTTLVLSILNGSSSYLQIRSTIIKAWMGLNIVKIPSPIIGLAPIGHLKN